MAKSQRPVLGKKNESPEEELARRQGYERIRQKAASPKKLGDVLPTLMARRGYAQVRSGGDLQAAWQKVVGSPLANFTRAGKLQRGVLEVIVGNSTVLQELTFGQGKLLADLQKLAPDSGVQKLRFRTGKIA